LGPAPDTDLDGDLERLAAEASPNRRPNFGRVIKGRPPELGTSPTNRTPLPKELSLHAISADELIYLRNENGELRKLIEQAIAQEGEFTEQLNQAGEREAELQSQINTLEQHGRALAEQVSRLKAGAGDTGELIVRLQEREDDVRLLTEQVQQLEAHLQFAQKSNGADQYIQAIQERDRAIEALNGRIAELEQQIAEIPPPPPTDEELAKLADELERERCKVLQLRNELDNDKKTHSEDIADFERQMREMEVQLSKERAEMARQRGELQRMQAEVRTELESVQRGDGALRDKLAQFQRKPGEAEKSAAKPAPKPAQQPAAAPPAQREKKEPGLMGRFFGKK
jgi:DNA repair exonuclease SbcCD ATPase subunit